MNKRHQYLENASQFFIETPMVNALHEHITQWTWCGLTGGIIIGEARSGKTVGVGSLSSSIDSRNGQKIPVFKITFGKRDNKTIRTVFDKIARTLGFDVKKKYVSDQLAEMICSFLSEAALINDTHQVLLLVDEAQLLSVDQLSVFAEIYNDLFDMHVNVVVFFIANKDQFTPLAERLLEKENTYIRERFFSHIYEFYGLRTSREVAECLKGYDRYMIDITNKITATEYYCPSLYKSGWRLASIANTYWSLYSELYKKPLHHTSWNMSQFIRSTNILLMDYLPSCPIRNNDRYIKESIKKSLVAAGIEPNLIKMVS